MIKTLFIENRQDPFKRKKHLDVFAFLI